MFDCFCLLVEHAFFFLFRLKLFLKQVGFQFPEIAKAKNNCYENVEL